jgi:hypothetical protein
MPIRRVSRRERATLAIPWGLSVLVGVSLVVIVVEPIEKLPIHSLHVRRRELCVSEGSEGQQALRATMVRGRWSLVAVREGAGVHVSGSCGRALWSRGRREQWVVSVAACEHVFVTIKGRPYTWLRDALARGDLAGVRAAALEVPRVQLADALAIVLLMAEHGDGALDPAATKWVGRLALERQSVRLVDLQLAVVALEILPQRPRDARAILADLCERHALEGIVGLDGGAD